MFFNIKGRFIGKLLWGGSLAPRTEDRKVTTVKGRGGRKTTCAERKGSIRRGGGRKRRRRRKRRKKRKRRIILHVLSPLLSRSNISDSSLVLLLPASTSKLINNFHM